LLPCFRAKGNVGVALAQFTHLCRKDTFTYTAVGERVRVNDGQETYWAYDGRKLLREGKTDGSSLRTYRHNLSAVPGSVLEVVFGGNTYVYGHNQRGDVAVTLRDFGGEIADDKFVTTLDGVPVEIPSSIGLEQLYMMAVPGLTRLQLSEDTMDLNPMGVSLPPIALASLPFVVPGVGEPPLVNPDAPLPVPEGFFIEEKRKCLAGTPRVYVASGHSFATLDGQTNPAGGFTKCLRLHHAANDPKKHKLLSDFKSPEGKRSDPLDSTVTQTGPFVHRTGNATNPPVGRIGWVIMVAFPIHDPDHRCMHDIEELEWAKGWNKKTPVYRRNFRQIRSGFSPNTPEGIGSGHVYDFAERGVTFDSFEEARERIKPIQSPGNEKVKPSRRVGPTSLRVKRSQAETAADPPYDELIIDCDVAGWNRAIFSVGQVFNQHIRQLQHIYDKGAPQSPLARASLRLTYFAFHDPRVTPFRIIGWQSHSAQKL